jgi:hypothetical protein
VYFGTGNIQRPAAIPDTRPGAPPSTVLRNLRDSSISGIQGNQERSWEADVLGVVWDSPDVPAGGYELSELANVTTTPEVDPRSERGQRGFFIELDEEEKVLRPPLVFDGVAFFQTYQPIRPATECEDAVGQSFTYAFENCSAEPVTTQTTPGGDPDRRIRSNPDSFIGRGLSVLVPDPGEGDEMVMGGDMTPGEAADLQSEMEEEPQGGVRLLMWRVNLD